MTTCSQLTLPSTVSASDEVQSSQLSTRPSAKPKSWPKGFYENQQGSNRQRNEKQVNKRKKRKQWELLWVIICYDILSKRICQQLPAYLICILLIPHPNRILVKTLWSRQFHPHRRSLYLSQRASLNEVISHEFWQNIAEKGNRKTWWWLLLLLLLSLLLLLLLLFNLTHTKCQKWQKKLTAIQNSTKSNLSKRFVSGWPINPEKCTSPQARKHQNPHRSEP